jgi:hypothetical protein
MALDEELGGGGRCERLIVDDVARAHSATAKRLAGIAVHALSEMHWPDGTGNIEGPDGMFGVVIPGSTVRNLVRRTLADAVPRAS